MATSPDGTSLDVAEFVNHGSWQHAGKPDPNCSACKAGLGFAGRYLKPMRRFDDAPEQTAHTGSREPGCSLWRRVRYCWFLGE